MGPLEDDSLSLFFLCILEDSKSPPNLESRCCIALIVIQVQYKLFPNNVVWLQALDTFNTAVVSPIYYAGFTSFTILASAIMFKVLLCAHAHGKRERECALHGCV